MTKEQEQALWKDMISGNKRAFENLYKQYFQVLISYGFRITQNENLIEDAIQELFISLWNNRTHLSEVSEVKFYLFRSLKNRIVRQLERDIFDKSEDIDSYLDFLISISEEQKKIDSEQSDTELDNLQKAISHLPLRQQEVINLKYYHDFTLDEIAKLMDVNKQSVSNLLFRSYATLRNILKSWTIQIFFLKYFILSE
ncbi:MULTISPECIES: RNA polymerase sigma factor [Emticicia]|uniref:RNA polymerase sigma factor n=1 Tax=Emticicia TaxID=312278 RepID=UPI0012E89486|nr:MULTISPECIES: sigma-70 family RNA polymerase sigma factor [Emticicia]